MRFMRMANLDGHDRKRFTELRPAVDVDSARDADFERLDQRQQERIINAFLKKCKRRGVELAR